MTFEPGQSGNLAGCPKGTTHKFTKTVKEAFLEVFKLKGDVTGLLNWADEHETEFYQMVSKMLPREMNLSGPEGGDHKIVIIRAKQEEVKQPDGKPTDTTKTISG